MLTAVLLHAQLAAMKSIPESTRPIPDIIREHVTVLPGHIGLKLSNNTPIEESLSILDWTTTLSEHCRFMIGDVVNFGFTKFGVKKYERALHQTGRASDINILRYCAAMSGLIPPDQRKWIGPLNLDDLGDDSGDGDDWWKQSRYSRN